MAIYELHIRDFSAHDETVPQHLRGKYMAFCERQSTGVSHLRRLSDGGITHLHLLPTYDFGSVPEREEDRAPQLDWAALAALRPDSQEQQVVYPPSSLQSAVHFLHLLPLHSSPSVVFPLPLYQLPWYA